MKIDVPIKTLINRYPNFLFIRSIIMSGHDNIVSSNSAYKSENQGKHI